MFYFKKSPFFTRGESLVEVMIACFLLTVGLLGLFSSLYSSQDLLSLSNEYSLSIEISQRAINRLRAEKDFGSLYAKYKIYDNSGPSHRFYILADQSIDWSGPGIPPKSAIGEGYFQFVINEQKYSVQEWGTDTAFFKDGQIHQGMIDLDGDGDAENKDIILGRTAGTPLGQKDGYYIVLPVKVVVRIYGGGNYDDLQMEKKALIFKDQR